MSGRHGRSVPGRDDTERADAVSRQDVDAGDPAAAGPDPEGGAPDEARPGSEGGSKPERPRRGGLIGIARLPGDLFWQLGVLIPAAVKQLNEADAAFGQPAREQAIGRERSWFARVRPV